MDKEVIDSLSSLTETLSGGIVLLIVIQWGLLKALDKTKLRDIMVVATFLLQFTLFGFIVWDQLKGEVNESRNPRSSVELSRGRESGAGSAGWSRGVVPPPLHRGQNPVRSRTPAQTPDPADTY